MRIIVKLFVVVVLAIATALTVTARPDDITNGGTASYGCWTSPEWSTTVPSCQTKNISTMPMTHFSKSDRHSTLLPLD